MGRAVFWTTVIVSLILLFQSIHPGCRFDSMGYGALLVEAAAVTLLVIFYLIAILLDGRRFSLGQRIQWKHWLLWVVTWTLTGYFLSERIALKDCFALCASGFTERLAEAPLSRQPGGLSFQVGPYDVDAYCRDSDGGVYFRTGSHLSFVDRVSHGFAYRPNSSRTPFGHAGLELTHLFGEWYVFTVSND